MRKKTGDNFLFFLALALLLIILGVFIYLNFSAPPENLDDSTACQSTDWSGEFKVNEKVAIFDGVQIPAGIAYETDGFDDKAVLSLAAPSEKWVEVDLSEQKLKAWEGNSLFLETPVSTGLPWWQTPEGEFRIWIKLRYAKMEGGEGKYYYYLPNVPYIMYFENSQIPGWRGYGLHGTYWHNDFGIPRSHGCVNLPTDVAERLFYWTTPVIPKGKSAVFADEANPGTRVVIHE
jgi:hypothetical protein